MDRAQLRKALKNKLDGRTDLSIGVLPNAAGVIPEKSLRKAKPQLSPFDFGIPGLHQALLQDVKFSLAHRSFQAQQ